MKGFVLQFLWYVLYYYYVESNAVIEKGIKKRILVFFLGMGLLFCTLWFKSWVVWAGITILYLLYDLFFDEETSRSQWRFICVPGIAFAAASFLPAKTLLSMNGFLLLLIICLSACKRGYLRASNGLITGLLLGLVSLFLWMAQTGRIKADSGMTDCIIWGSIMGEYLLFILLEGTFQFYQRGFTFQSESFRKEVLRQQYEEIKMIYKDMRGWRHDYHNHIQVLKAQLALGKFVEVSDYLDKLEESLNQIDTYVKSGNQMIDAILNGKLSLARDREISVNCKAQMPETLPVSDVDLCVILGNLLDNALEACEEIVPGQRFLRIYMARNKSQLYISIQNSAKEDLDFKDRHYISTKRGNHGLGMKRVQAAVEKYDGFLHLANEPGIFAAEITMPV